MAPKIELGIQHGFNKLWLINDEGCGNDDVGGDGVIRSFFPWKK